MSGDWSPGDVWFAEGLKADLDLDCDVCVIGSGAGGAVLAAGLAEAGHRVLLMEEGPRYSRQGWDGDEARAYRDLYQDQGFRSTADGSILILQGRSVGGGTTVNWTTCYRTPSRILEHWRSKHGIEGLDEASLAPHFDAVEARLNIHRWSEAPPNANNQVILDGAAKLGWEAAVTARNVRGCANSGYCGLGCPVDGKQAMHLTYIPDGQAAGMGLLVGARAVRIEHVNGVASEVSAVAMDPATKRPTGVAIRVSAGVVVVSCGAINSPALLLRSGVNPGGRVGKRTMLHPVAAVVTRFDKPIHGYFGAPQSAASHQHVDRGADRVGFFIEAAPLQPMMASLPTGYFGAAHAELMTNLSHISSLIALSVDGLVPGDEGGTTSIRSDGAPKLDYPVGPALVECFRASHEALVMLGFAAGASIVGTTHARQDVRLSAADQIGQLANLRYGAGEHGIFSAHQMGGCCMGGDPERSVVDTDHRVRGFKNLFVVDGSVLPTALGVNPSETIYGLAHRARASVGAAV